MDEARKNNMLQLSLQILGIMMVELHWTPIKAIDYVLEVYQDPKEGIINPYPIEEIRNFLYIIVNENPEIGGPVNGERKDVPGLLEVLES